RLVAPAGVNHYTLTAIDARTTTMFTGANVVPVNSPANSITLNNQASLRTGQAVVYRAGSGTPIPVANAGALVSDAVYYIIVPDPNQPNVVRLAATFQDAIAGSAIRIAAPAVGTVHSLTPAFGFANMAYLSGGQENDTFGLLGGAGVTGSIDGG